MKRKALIKDGKVTDMIIAGDDYKPPAGFRLIEALDANIGDLFVNDRFTRPRIKSSRDDLLRVARIRRSLTSNWSFVFELESGEKVQVPADISARQDLLEIASLGIDSKFLFPEGPREVTAKDFANIVRAIAERTAKNHAVLADVAEAIDREQIVFEDQINEPEKLGLKKWID